MTRRMLTVVSIGVLTLTGCTSADHERSSATADRSIQVLAAASLQQAFDELTEEFTAQHPDIDIDISYAGSSTLVHNLQAGAPADVLATADEASMDAADEAGLIDSSTQATFATNTLVGIVPRDNPADVDTLQDLTSPEIDFVMCAPQVPCGALAQSVAEGAGVRLQPVSEEHQVVDVLGKVRSGQADAGLVYATDAAAASDDVSVFSLDGADELPNRYPIARTSETDHVQGADVFIALVHSDQGQALLASHGFGLP